MKKNKKYFNSNINIFFNIEEYTKKPNILTRLLTNKLFLTIIFTLTFISVCILVNKTFYYGKKVDEYDNLILKIKKKEETEAKIYINKEIDNNTLRKVAATELINCLNSNIDTNNLPDNIKNIVNEINNYYNESNNYFSFAYKDLFTGFTVSYNENQQIFAASTIKAPKDIYIYEMASQNKIDLNEVLTYTSNFYSGGTGMLQTKPVNTKYKVKELVSYSTITSDNIAHAMLMNRYGRKNMLNYWQEKGTNTIFTENNIWGPINAHDAIIYMEELYKFYLTNEEYGTEVMNNFLKSYPKFITGKNNYSIASKDGWAGSAIHDISIIFADNPYIVVALSNLGNTEYYQSYFNKANDLAYKLHIEYWKYKMNLCQNIKQY